MNKEKIRECRDAYVARVKDIAKEWIKFVRTKPDRNSIEYKRVLRQRNMDLKLARVDLGKCLRTARGK